MASTNRMNAATGQVSPEGSRPDATQQADVRHVSLAFVGDICLGGGLQADLRRHGADYPFAKLGSVFDGADIVVGNLECCIVDPSDEPEPAFGRMAGMPQILEVAARHGAVVVEDAAWALGSELDGRRAGSWGVIGCFSFHPRKAITTGEGGMITTNDAGLARQLRALRNHGLDSDSATPDFIMPGYNMRLAEFQAAMGLTQFAKLDRLIEARRTQATAYADLFAGTGIVPSREALRSRHVFQSFVALLPPDVAFRRAEVIATLQLAGIETTIGTYHMPMTTFLRHRGRHAEGEFPVTDDIARPALSLPLYEGLTADSQETAVRALDAALQLAPQPMAIIR